MSKDTSLSEFAGTAEDESENEQGDDERVQGEGNREQTEDEQERTVDESVGTDEDDASGPDLDEIEPARATYDWTPTGADCACCGTSVEKRWRADDGMVCADCKEW